MASNFKQNKPQRAGSGYINLPKKTQIPPGQFQQVIDWLNINRAMIKISIGSNREYKDYIGFFNQYKREGVKDPDIVFHFPKTEVENKFQPKPRPSFQPRVVEDISETTRIRTKPSADSTPFPL